MTHSCFTSREWIHEKIDMHLFSDGKEDKEASLCPKVVVVCQNIIAYVYRGLNGP